MPRIEDILLDDGTIIYRWATNESISTIMDMASETSIDISHILHIKAERRRIEIIAEYLLLRDIYGENTILDHYPNGAPFLPQHNTFISISHTEGMIIIAMNKKHPIGIDIETIQERVVRIRGKFINEVENGFINASSQVENTAVWTAKEALFKLAPDDGIDFREHLHLDKFSFSEGDTISHTAFITRSNPTIYCKLTTFIFPLHVITVATEANN